MSRLVPLFLQKYQAETILDALRCLQISFQNRGLDATRIDELVELVEEQLRVYDILRDY